MTSDAKDLLQAASIALDVRGAEGSAEGTGFLVAPGIVATCAHVLGERSDQLPSTVRGRLAVGGERDLEVVADWYLRDTDRGLDLAFLRMPDAASVPHVLLKSSIEVGDRLWTFGYPAGMFRGGQSALFTYQGRSRLLGVGDADQALSAARELGRAVGTPVGGGYSGSAVLNLRTGAVVGLLCTSDGRGSAHMVLAADLIAGNPAVAQAQVEGPGTTRWLRVLTDDQIRAGGWRFPGSRLRAYLDAAIRAAREHPYPGALPGSPTPSLSAVYVRRRANATMHDKAVADSHDPPDTIPAEQVMERKGNAILLAGPGAGKSSLLRAGLITVAERWRSGETSGSIPVRVLAADLVPARPLTDAIAASVNADLSTVGILELFPPTLFAAEPLPGVAWLLLVDGLDEIADPASRRRVIAKLAGAAESDPPAPYHFLIATRPLPEGELPVASPSGFAAQHYDLQPLAPDEIEHFAERWFAALAVPEPQAAARQFTEQLHTSGLAELASIPLMVSMLCQLRVANPLEQAPTRPLEVYERFVELLQDRQYSAGLSGIYAQIRSSLEGYGSAAQSAADRELDASRALIARLASARYAGDTTSAVDILSAWTESRRPRHLPERIWANLMAEILRRSGLVTERANDFIFIHQTILEYLAAQHDATDEDAIRRAFQFLMNPSGEIRFWLVRSTYYGALIAYGQDVPAVTKALMEMVTRDGLGGGWFIAQCVTAGARVSPQVVDAAVAALTTTSTDSTAYEGNQIRAVTTLVKLGAKIDPRAIEALRSIARDTRAYGNHRVEANIALAGLDDPQARSQLASIAADPRIKGGRRNRLGPRRDALNALARLGDAQSLDLLARVAASTKAGVIMRCEAAQALAKAGDLRAPGLLAAIAGPHKAGLHTRLVAAQALAQLGDARAPDLLADIAAIRETDYYRGMHIVDAAETLADIGDARGLDLLAAIAARRAGHPHIQFDAAEALAMRGDARGFNLLASISGIYHEDALRVLAKLRDTPSHEKSD
jgi:Trypsin-like peptidase domain